MSQTKPLSYGINKMYYAVRSTTEQGGYTYGNPVRLRGARQITINAEGTNEKFYADNFPYYVAPAVNGGYTGTLTLAKVPSSFRVDVLGEVVDDNGMQVEIADATSKSFALMYEVEGDADQKRYVFFNCTAQRIAAGANTKSDSTSPDTQDLEFTAIGKDFTLAGQTKNIVQGSASTSDTAFDGWYTTVPVPTKASA